MIERPIEADLETEVDRPRYWVEDVTLQPAAKIEAACKAAGIEPRLEARGERVFLFYETNFVTARLDAEDKDVVADYRGEY